MHRGSEEQNTIIIVSCLRLEAQLVHMQLNLINETKHIAAGCYFKQHIVLMHHKLKLNH